MEDTVRSIWRLPKVMAMTGLSRSTIYQLVADGSFPRAVRLSRRSVGWRSDEVERWITERVAAPGRSESAA
ncbi:MAG: helix-turn-helix transcriptional regulator [Polyangia bacterium]